MHMTVTLVRLGDQRFCVAPWDVPLGCQLAHERRRNPGGRSMSFAGMMSQRVETRTLGRERSWPGRRPTPWMRRARWCCTTTCGAPTGIHIRLGYEPTVPTVHDE